MIDCLHGENRARRLHQYAVGVASHQHFADRRAAPDPDDAQFSSNFLHHGPPLRRGFSAPDGLADAELDAGFFQCGPGPVEVGLRGEAGVGQCVAAGGVDDDERLITFPSNASGGHQGGPTGWGGGVADNNGHFGISLFSVGDGPWSVGITSTWWCSATASAGSSEISSTTAAAFAGSTFRMALKSSGQSRINAMIAYTTMAKAENWNSPVATSTLPNSPFMSPDDS